MAGIVTGLLAGLPLFSSAGVWSGVPYLTQPGQEGMIDLLGRAFAQNRLMTLFIITLPAIGLCERYGLQEQSAQLIQRFRGASVGRLNLTYQLWRVLIGLMGLRLNGHPVFVRPLLFPMSLGAARRYPEVSLAQIERLKASNAAAENYGNFYGQNLSPVQAGILLVYGVLQELGYSVNLWSLVLGAIPITAISVLLGAVQFSWLDRSLATRERR
jgi:uncharacterized membrane protein